MIDKKKRLPSFPLFLTITFILAGHFFPTTQDNSKYMAFIFLPLYISSKIKVLLTDLHLLSTGIAKFINGNLLLITLVGLLCLLLKIKWLNPSAVKWTVVFKQGEKTGFNVLYFALYLSIYSPIVSFF